MRTLRTSRRTLVMPLALLLATPPVASSQPLLAPPDRLLFLRDSALMAQRLDLARVELVGDPVEALALSRPVQRPALSQPAS